MKWYVNGKSDGDYLVLPVSTNIYLGGTAIFWATNDVAHLPVPSSWVSAPYLGVDLPNGTTVSVTPTNPGTYFITGTSLADPDLSDVGRLIVSNISLEMPPYLGIKMTDPIDDPVDFETAKVNADPSASCDWSLNSAITHFDPEPGNGLTATVKEQGNASGAYREEEISVVVSQDSIGEVELETNFTVVRIDIEMQGLGEANEETVGGVVWLNSDDDNTNGVPDLAEAPVTNENDLVPVVITLYPSGLPGDETVSIAGGNLYEDMEKRTPASSSYPVSSFPLTLYVEGKNVSSSPRDKEITVTHVLSGATDKVKYTVCGVDLDIDSENHWGSDYFTTNFRTESADAIEDIIGENMSKIVFVNDIDKDADEIPDFMDGWNCPQSQIPTLERELSGKRGANTKEQFVPMILEIAVPLNLASSVRVKFVYPESKPSTMELKTSTCLVAP